MPSATPTRPPISDSVTASTRNWPQDVARARADRHAQADLARALGDRHQHDVHDADAADHQRHRGDRGEQQRQHAAGGFLRGGDLLAGCAARSRRPAPGCRRWRWRSRPRICSSAAFMSSPSAHLDPDGADAALLGELVAPSTRLRAVVIGIRTRSSWSVPIMLWPLASSTPITVNGTRWMRICLAERIGAAEQLPRHGLADQAHLGRARHVGGVEQRARGERPLAHVEVLGRDAVDHRGPVLRCPRRPARCRAARAPPCASRDLAR